MAMVLYTSLWSFCGFAYSILIIISAPTAVPHSAAWSHVSVMRLIMEGRRSALNATRGSPATAKHARGGPMSVVILADPPRAMS